MAADTDGITKARKDESTKQKNLQVNRWQDRGNLCALCVLCGDHFPFDDEVSHKEHEGHKGKKAHAKARRRKGNFVAACLRIAETKSDRKMRDRQMGHSIIFLSKSLNRSA